MKYLVTLNNTKYEVEVEAIGAAPASPVVTPATPAQAPAQTSAPAVNVNPTADGEKILSPMPGTILGIETAVGKAVNAGDVLFILEAMKMENEIVAANSGTILEILVTKGTLVSTDQALAVIG